MPLKVTDLGLVDFQDARVQQRELFREVEAGLWSAGLIVCRHYPAITVSRRANRNNILVSQEELKNKGISVYEVERGGDVTYHGPGQLIAYPVFNLNYFKKDIHWFLEYLEGLIIRCLDEFGVKGERAPGLTGVWAGRLKIASIGIAVRNWITFHGLSINIKSNDLANFSLIRPCGMDIMVTSMESETGGIVQTEEVKQNLVSLFKASSGFSNRD
ncbi:MAG: lipoyl(octanoyl) transferase LipB [Candidatus Omnitrophica bacterium]|nr:lipoyl(octanoyl) transferase LipB [Candidatus Omnitrophota bacterium]